MHPAAKTNPVKGYPGDLRSAWHAGERYPAATRLLQSELERALRLCRLPLHLSQPKIHIKLLAMAVYEETTCLITIDDNPLTV
jgi:hypothetical protein